MTRASLRTLLLVSVLTTITIAFATFAFYIDRVEQTNRLADIDSELIRAERTGPAPAPPAGQDGNPPPASTTDGAEDNADLPVQLIVRSSGEVIGNTSDTPFSAEQVAALAERIGTRSIDNPRYRVRTTLDGRSVRLTALSLESFDAAVSEFRAALLLGGGTILVLVAALLWALTSYLARPVTRMAETASRIADGELDTAISLPGGSRETAQLASDLDRMVTSLRAGVDDATQARDAMKRFLADMAHEIRTPLTALRGYSDLYANGMLQKDADIDRAMSRIGSESQRLANMANGMLQLANNETTVRTPELFDLAEVTSQVAEDLRAAYPDTEIVLAIPTVCPMRGFPAQLHQAILNLGSNACHHGPDGSPVEVSVGAEDELVTVTVADHGMGLTQDEIDRIFVPFYRSDTARSRTGQEGAGLGLALTKQIVDQHRGEIAVTETTGGGATFTLTLPKL